MSCRASTIFSLSINVISLKSPSIASDSLIGGNTRLRSFNHFGRKYWMHSQLLLIRRANLWKNEQTRLSSKSCLKYFQNASILAVGCSIFFSFGCSSCSCCCWLYWMLSFCSSYSMKPCWLPCSSTGCWKKGMKSCCGWL